MWSAATEDNYFDGSPAGLSPPELLLNGKRPLETTRWCAFGRPDTRLIEWNCKFREAFRSFRPSECNRPVVDAVDKGPRFEERRLPSFFITPPQTFLGRQSTALPNRPFVLAHLSNGLRFIKLRRFFSSLWENTPNRPSFPRVSVITKSSRSAACNETEAYKYSKKSFFSARYVTAAEHASTGRKLMQKTENRESPATHAPRTYTALIHASYARLTNHEHHEPKRARKTAIKNFLSCTWVQKSRAEYIRREWIIKWHCLLLYKGTWLALVN